MVGSKQVSEPPGSCISLAKGLFCRCDGAEGLSRLAAGRAPVLVLAVCQRAAAGAGQGTCHSVPAWQVPAAAAAAAARNWKTPVQKRS